MDTSHGETSRDDTTRDDTTRGGAARGGTTRGGILRGRAETLKIARLLDVEPRRLAFLEGLPADDVRLFRERAVAALFDEDRGLYDRIAGLTRLLPAGVAAGIAQKALGPRLAAALAGRLEPGRAADIIDRLPADFTARCCHHVDPRRIAAIMGLLDDDIVVRVALVLAERGDHLTMGRFVGHLRDSALRNVLPRLGETTLLRTGFVIDHPERLGHIVALLDDERVRAVIAAAADHGLWPEALAVAGMAGEQRARIASLTAAQPKARLDSLVRVTAEQDLWESLLPIVSLLGEDERRTVAALPALRDPAVLDGLVRGVVATGLWGDFLPVVRVLPPTARRIVARVAGALSDADLEALARGVDKEGLWELVLPLVELMDEEGRRRVLALAAVADAPVPAALRGRAAGADS
ncbi:hypothetical protein QFZ75_005713 [Streptomyces sp. V3I8]|uniref:hypothetical protein n=1 Tax=Streptomyces sp. V3I8 TaxID=3042279 RepID=UPI002783CB99|nr:hypothetical protein [Streptomyces sp. V3I8]MDQ1039297.1 hypothetical protein [Streptomyces sp. V3I8]